MKGFFILFFIVICFFGFSDSIIIDNEPLENIKLNAEKTAIEDSSKLLWFSAGFFFNTLGIVGGFLYEPTPPASQLVGKSSDYIRVYTDYYIRKAKKIQIKYATWGCAASTTITVIIYIIYVYYYWNIITNLE